jgi:phosphoribosylaminoimidazolecarboxamide formyltransferase/IMP cyclohydrolase
MDLRYGTNPHQRAWLDDPAGALRLVSGAPSYINVLDALNGYALVREASGVLGGATATSFKHVSPAGAATAGPLDAAMAATWKVAPDDVSPITSAYVRARDADPKSSFGDFVAVSEPVDRSLAEVLRGVISDGIVAPGFEPGVVEVLAAKKRGAFVVFQADAAFEPPVLERRDVCGLTLIHERDRSTISASLLEVVAGKALSQRAARDALLGMVTVRHTQSNSVGFVRDGMLVGIGAGQQSRIDCTKLAGAKADLWWLRRHPSVQELAFRAGVSRQDRLNWQLRYLEDDLDPSEQRRFVDAITGTPQPVAAAERAAWLAALGDVACVSDGSIPFRDNIDQAARHGVSCVVEPGGSARAADVVEACEEHAITLVQTGLRLFHH